MYCVALQAPEPVPMLQVSHVESASVEPVHGPTSCSPTLQLAFVHELHTGTSWSLDFVTSLYFPAGHGLILVPVFVIAAHPAALLT